MPLFSVSTNNTSTKNTSAKNTSARRARTRRVAVVLLLLCLGLGAIFIIADDDPLVRREISFVHAGHTLKGVLVLPSSTAMPDSCVVFVHGSGDMPRDAYGYYEPLWRLFVEQGWCSLSWDKPGVGESEGDWRLQSMADRADEVAEAIEFLHTHVGLGERQTGLIGFSQAGWVLPKVANLRDDITFLISVSGAVNWLDQSRYSGRQRMIAEGLTEQEIKAEEYAAQQVNALIQRNAPYTTYLEHIEGEVDVEPMSEAFWGFAKRNWQADVRSDLEAIKVPMLALFGSHDAYVDPVSSATAYRQLLERSAAPFFEVHRVDDADHSLMKSDQLKPDHQGMGAWLKLFKIWFLGDAIFADGVLDSLTSWLNRFPKAGTQPTSEGS
ncbi:alpha/beta hydrolase family protein [Vreelandella venusta]|uniref:Alpha/beta hydrolase n=1 Tax=Vreelandella venusta TaxID=44935 RepID=A0ABX2BGK3_9GAMM|nr:alpha/beta hydrolase [Halomonas venusta]AZM95590.1 alpha/beta hydrolase [Halomonas venusta]NPT32066.1 alpha/beta hydrolase [Halomonas venusta]